MKALVFLPAIAALLVLGFSPAAAQESIAPAGDTPSYDLIAWSWMQTPEPIPQQSPAPDAQPQAQQTPSEPAEPGQNSSSAQPDAASSQSDTAIQSLVGTISKDGDSYVLKVSDTASYKLDDQKQAKRFEGQKVRVSGIVDMNLDLVRVQKIEPLS